MTVPQVLFVDLDGTLVATDVLREALGLAIKRKPWTVMVMPLWLLRGRAGFKRAVAQHVQPDPKRLPYRADVLTLIDRHKSEGCIVVLATANDRVWAQAIADHLGVFDEVIASDGQDNLKGRAKLVALQAYCRQNGFATFAYVGDSSADIPIWDQAAMSYVVCPSPSLVSALKRSQRPWQAIGIAHHGTVASARESARD